MRKNCTNQYKILEIDTFGGGGERDFMDKTILWTSGRFRISAGYQRVPKSEGYLNRSFPGVKKMGDKGGGEEGRSGGRANRA